MRLLKSHWRRPRFEAEREFWRGRYSFGVQASARLGDPTFKVRLGTWAFSVWFLHAADCGCDHCIPF